jgi:regulator of protease activity HflC (stomatin/prohibitin superfamily)
MDDVLGAGRAQASTELHQLLEKRFNDAHAGVQILFVGIAGVHPPTVTAAMFEKVVETRIQRQAAIEAAHKDETDILTSAVGSVDLAKQIVAEQRTLERMKTELKDGKASEADVIKQEQHVEDLLTSAGGEAAIIIEKAKADRWKTHMTARGRAERYQSQLLAYQAGHEVYLSSLYYDMLKDVLNKARVYITPDDSGAAVELRIDAHEDADTSDIFKHMTTNPETGP